MNQKDFSNDVDYINSLPPTGFDYWDPSWELREEMVNGKLVRKVIKPDNKPKMEEVKTEEQKTMVEVFECNHCDYKCDTKQGIMMHIRKKHAVN